MDEDKMPKRFADKQAVEKARDYFASIADRASPELRAAFEALLAAADRRVESPALDVDPTGVIAYLTVREGRHHKTVADLPCVNADFDAEGNLLGVEFVVWPLDGRPAVPQAWPPVVGDEDNDNEDEKGSE
ncbi:MAG TPA: DUF2283 domain-containing protein [Phycisphaerae bacterium]|nr:DUF2283 domain-containing protein [Phycisphaerae bacterium]